MMNGQEGRTQEGVPDASPAYSKRGQIPIWAGALGVVVSVLAVGGYLWLATPRTTMLDKPAFPAIPAVADQGQDQRFLATLAALRPDQRLVYCESHSADVAAIKADRKAHTRFVSLMRIR